MPDFNFEVDPTELSLEDKLLRLQEIQKMLENNSVKLTDSVKLYKIASDLRDLIETELNDLKLKITQIESKNTKDSPSQFEI